MRILRIVLTFCLLATLSAQAAPLFPDVPDNHWAKDAVAALAAKGLVEGYPDGTFKGDRSASRWETAMVVARLLAKMEQAHATFATKAELAELRRLAEALREELGALGVRVDNLEEQTEQIDKRVSELERITFYGSFQTRVGFQSFKNDGSPGMGVFNYDRAVGNVSGAGGPITSGPLAGGIWNPNVIGVRPVIDFPLGRPLTNGTTMTALAILGLKTEITPDIVGGVEFAAFTSQGDAVVDAFYGIPAPYLANPFTAQVNDPGAQPLNNRPFTRMVMDNAWLSHKPSRTQLVIGSFRDTNFDEILFKEAQNPNTNTFDDPFLQAQSGRLPNFGVQIKGEIPLDDGEVTVLDWEVMGTRLGNGNISPVTGGSYQSYAWGGNLGLRFDEDRGKVRVNFLHAADEAQGGGALAVGNIQFPNIAFLNWVNPPGHFFNQLPAQQTAGIGSTGDTRPIVSNAALNNDGNHGIAGVPNRGGFGPQIQTGYGLSAEYTFDSPVSPRIFAEWAHTDYRPQRNSSYTADGDAFRLGAEASFFDETLDVSLVYQSVDPRFSPYILQYPRVGGIPLVQIRTPTSDMFPPLFSLHNTEVYPHNREGYTAKVKWWFNDNGQISVLYGNWDQKDPSVQDVRFSPNSLGAGVPNTPVLGFSPGWIDPGFPGLSPLTYAAAGNNALATPLESPVGQVDRIKVSGAHEWEIAPNRGVTLSGEYVNYNFRRDSNLSTILANSPAGIRGENQNFIDFNGGGFIIGVDYDWTEDFKLLARYTQVDVHGHSDPAGLYSNYAETIGSSRFDTVNFTQTIPSLGFSWDIEENVNWGMEGRYFQTRDHLTNDVFASPANRGLNLDFGPQSGTHPFNWSGWQVNTVFTVKI